MKVFQALLYLTTLFFCERVNGDTFKKPLLMPKVHPDKEDSYICTSMKLPEGDSYIVEYEPKAHKDTAHHMLLYGCKEPGEQEESWNCGNMGSGTCGGQDESILFGWAKDAPPLTLPKDVGFKVGGKTKIKYFVLQIHYVHPLKDGQSDSSGLIIHMTSEKQPNLASIYLLYASSANILPNTKGIHVDIACEYGGDDEIHAFAFRTHAHDLGRVITGYRVRNNVWKLLGKGDPQAPQAFYPMENVVTIKKGDILAARCTYDTINTQRTEVTHIGSASSDEMCNFYMMYYHDTLANNVAPPEGCGDQFTLEHLFRSFPHDSDVALASSSSGHHHHHMHHTVKESNIEGTNETTKSEVVESNTFVHNSDFERPETNGRDGLGDDVTTSNVVLPDSNAREEKTTFPSTEAWEQEGRQISNHITDTSEPTTRYNSEDGDNFLDGEKQIRWNTTDTRLPQGMSTISSTIETADGSERQNHVTDDVITDVITDVTSDVSTSTSVSEQTTRAVPFTVEPTTRLKEKKNGVKGHWKVLGEDSTIEAFTGRTTAQGVGTRPYGGDENEVEHEHVDKLSVVDDWPVKDVAKKLGQVTGLAVDSAGRVFVFHRAGRKWEFDTFNEDDAFRSPQTRGTISKTTIFILDAKNGTLLKEWGNDMFYLPHGLTVDHEDNVWVTDVGAHQVMKFPRGEFLKPSLTLGKHLAPGSDERHFCKPTDVAVEKSGIFYVADGYCNGRIMKFSPEGALLKQWGEISLQSALNPRPSTFLIPHGLSLDEKHSMLYVADRENGRIQCFDANGTFHKQISSQLFEGRVFAVNYNDLDDVLYAVNGPSENIKVQGFTIGPTSGKILATWSPHNKGFSQPHAVVSNGLNVYVAEIGPNRVWKFEAPRKVDSTQSNFVRGINNAVEEDVSASDNHSQDETKQSNGPAVVILTILSVPAIILILVGLVSKIRGRKKLHKYDMMDETLTNHASSRNLCISMNCCRKPYHNMEELYLMDCDSDLEIYPDVHVDTK